MRQIYEAAVRRGFEGCGRVGCGVGTIGSPTRKALTCARGTRSEELLERPFENADMQTGLKRGRKTDRKTGMKTVRKTDRNMAKKTDRKADKKTGRKAGRRQTGTHTGRQEDSQEYRKEGGQEDTQ